MTDTRPRTLYELLLLSDFGRAHPERVRELIERAAAERHDRSVKVEPDDVRTAA